MSLKAELAILFADVSGSTELYDKLGDDRARRIIAHCVTVMANATSLNGGTLIKTIGDEVMTTFATADAAAQAAVDMQEAITGDNRMDQLRLAIRAGFHFGPVLPDNGDIFGDAVNLASRMVRYAKAGQIITTGDAAARLTSRLSAYCRRIDGVRIRGKHQELPIFELVWQAEDATMLRVPSPFEMQAASRLLLTAAHTCIEVNIQRPLVTLGRGEQNDIVIRQACVSRQHARIDHRNGRFVLTDLSTNGTFVLGPDREPRLVRRDSQPLAGSGVLGLGEAISDGSPVSVTYELL